MKLKLKKLKLGSKKKEPTTEELMAQAKSMSLIKPKPRRSITPETAPVNTKPWQGKTKTQFLAEQKAQIANDPFADLDEDSDPFDDLFESTTAEVARIRGQEAVDRGEKLQKMMDTKYGRGGQRVFTVKLGYNDHGLEEGQMLMEVVSMRETIPADWGVADWRKLMDTAGAVPFRIVFGDIDRYHKLIYAAEYLRIWETQEDQKLHGQWRPDNPDYDPSKEDIKQDGRTIGGIDDDPLTPPVIPVEGEFGISHRDPELSVREQMEIRQAAKLEEDRPNAKPAKYDKDYADANNPQMRVWELAIELAKKPRAEWEGKVDWMLEHKVKYCYSWLEEVGGSTVPYPDDMLEIFWQRSSLDPRDGPKIQRRNAITSKVLSFWRASITKNTNSDIDLKSTSYRTTLAAMELQRAIDSYVAAGAKFNMENEVQDKQEELGVHKAATAYFKAHFPIKTLGAGPGPLSTMDPNYVEYVRLCRQYGLTIGILLHEVQL